MMTGTKSHRPIIEMKNALNYYRKTTISNYTIHNLTEELLFVTIDTYYYYYYYYYHYQTNYEQIIYHNYILPIKTTTATTNTSI